MWNEVGGREAANIQKKSVSGYRLKKVMLASRESVRTLSEIFMDPHKNFAHFSGRKVLNPHRLRLTPEAAEGATCVAKKYR